MPTTPNYSLPYPALSDAPNGPAAFEDLADAVDDAVFAVEAGGIPKTLVNTKGDLVVATASDTVARFGAGSNGQVLTANSAETTGMSWTSPVAVDGASAAVATAESTSGTSYGDLTTPGPAVTVDVGASGIAIVTVNCKRSVTASGAGLVGFAISGASTVAASDAEAIRTTVQTAGGETARLTYSLSVVKTGLTPGSTTFTLKYRAEAGTQMYTDRQIGVVTF